MSAPEPRAPEHRSDLVGQTLMGKLQVVRLLGEGGMGAVYEVEHLITRHHRALKVMHRRYAESAETIARFIREAGVAGTLRTPHVVETYDAGQLEDGAPYVLMELLNGTTFATLLEATDRLSTGRVVGIVCQVLEGLAVAHDAGIVHRDIKPDNVFVSEDDRGRERVRILDFGISKFASGDRNSFTGAAFDGTLTSDHTVMGTPYYMSPEQATGAKLADERSDLYSVGVMLYEGLSGTRPYDAQNMAQLVIKIHAGEHEPLRTIAPQVSPELAAIVERAMHHDASARHASARELLAELLPHAESNYTSSLQTLRHVSSEAPRAAMPRPLPAPRKIDAQAQTLAATSVPTRPAWHVPAAIAAVVAIVGLGALAMMPGGEEPAATPTPTVLAPTPPPPTEPVVRTEPVTAPADVAAESEPAEAVVDPAVERETHAEGRSGRRRDVRRERAETAEPPGGTSSEPASTGAGASGGTGRRRIVRDVYGSTP